MPKNPPIGLGYNWQRPVLCKYEPFVLLRELQNLVKSLPCYDEDEEGDLNLADQRDPSYTLALRLHLSDDAMEELLKLDAPIHRLQFELEYVKNYRHFDCANCGNRLADVTDLISVHNETSRIRFCLFSNISAG